MKYNTDSISICRITVAEKFFLIPAINTRFHRSSIPLLSTESKRLSPQFFISIASHMKVHSSNLFGFVVMPVYYGRFVFPLLLEIYKTQAKQYRRSIEIYQSNATHRHNFTGTKHLCNSTATNVMHQLLQSLPHHNNQAPTVISNVKHCFSAAARSCRSSVRSTSFCECEPFTQAVVCRPFENILM